MAFHLVAYYDGTFAYTGLNSIPALSDPAFQRDTTTRYLIPPRDVSLLAAYSGANGITQARVVAPSLLRVSYPSIVPLEELASRGQETAISKHLERPLRLVAEEGISVEAANTGTGAAAVLVCGLGLEPVPPGEAFWVRYSSSVAVAAGQWALLSSVTWGTTLPAGTYAIVGMDHFSATAIAARLVLDGFRHRPGLVAHTSPGTTRSSAMFSDGSLGVWGHFSSRVMPGIEVLATAADASHTGYLLVVRTGEADLLPGLRSA